MVSSEEALTAVARQHVADILTLAIAHDPARAAAVVWDERSGLSRIVAGAYRQNLPHALQMNFDGVTPAVVLAALETLKAGDLVVLVQSTSFRLEAFRIRVELFKRGLKVIEHPHLGRMLPSEYTAYVDSLAYDPGYYRVLGRRLKDRIDRASRAVVDSGGAELVFASAFEPAKMNIGDYGGMANVGGQFPIGEIFTEAKDLSRVSGAVRIFVFGDTDFHINVPDKPITLIIEGGLVVRVIDSTVQFDRVLAQIRAEEEPWLRELGFGMNRALTPERRVSDVGTFERMCGIHLSLGAKHGVYNKAALPRKGAKYHVDIFAVTHAVWLDDEQVFENGAWKF